MQVECVSQTLHHQILLSNENELQYLTLFPSLVDSSPTKIKLTWSHYYDKLDTIVGMWGRKVVFQSTTTLDKHEEDFNGKWKLIIDTYMVKNKYSLWTSSKVYVYDVTM